MKHIKFISLVLLLTLLTGCGSKKNELAIAEQYGLAYAPLQIMREKKFLETALPEVTIHWRKMANTVATREAVLSKNLDVGFIGLPPFLIGSDQGMPWKIITGLSQSPLGLVTNSKNINTLEELATNGKIALPQPGSIQHILLSMAAEKQLNNSRIFDNQLISMKHPDGYQALNSGNDISAHFTSPPYLFQELDNESNNLILTGVEAMGEDFTFIAGVCTETFKENSEYYDALKESIKKSIDFIATDKESTIEILSKAYKLPKDVIEDYLYNRGIIYSTELKGLEKFIEFMYKEGYLEKLVDARDMIW